MLFRTCSVLGSLFLVFSFILELFLIIGQLSNQYFLTQIFFAEAWSRSQNLSYSFGLWNYCTGDRSRNIQSCASPRPAYNWARTPNIVDLVPNLANSKVVSGIFYALFIMLFVAMGLSFIFWLMSIPICCTKHKRVCGYSMSTLCFINFLITFVCVILALILILAGVRHITAASPDWDGHAGNAFWVLIGTCVANFLAMMCYSGGACCSRKKNKDDYDDEFVPAATSSKKKKGLFSGFGRNKKKTRVDPTYKDEGANDAINYDNLLPSTAQPTHHSHSPYTAHNKHTTMLQQPYTYDDPSTPAQPHATNVSRNTTEPATVPKHGYQTPILQPANAHE